MAVLRGRAALVACLGVLFACSGEPTFVDGPSDGGGEGVGANGGGATGGSGADGSGADGSGADGSGAGGGSASGGSGAGGASTGGVGAGGAGAAPAVCGNGFIEGAPEECDDGNLADGDGCTGCVVDCPPDGYKDPNTFHCYFGISQEPWMGGWQDCIDTAPGTNAAALSTLAEFDVVTAHFAGVGMTGQMWIGGAYDPGDGGWSWANGETWIYANDSDPWAGGFPQASGECVRVQPSDTKREMKNDGCNESKPMICERKPLGN